MRVRSPFPHFASSIFRTIVILSLLYTLGQITLAAASAFTTTSFYHPWLDLLGLGVIALGTGGIKPCVSPFGGDQFEPHQTRMISLFFSAFYFIINCGAMLSSIVSPLFRAHSCLGHDSCYPLAFGVPAALMITATAVFMVGSKWYKKNPPSSNIFSDVLFVVRKALQNKKTSLKTHSHWVEYSLDDHDCDKDEECKKWKRRAGSTESCFRAAFVADVRSFLRILVMFLPLPMFFALYDQQGSKWTIQALHMDLRIFGETIILPDQMLSLNAVLILIFIPLFQVIIFPAVEKVAKVTPLRKMVCGGLLTVVAFCIAAVVQIKINDSLPERITPDTSHLYTVNTLRNCQFIINSHEPFEDEIMKFPSGEHTFEFGYVGDGCVKNLPISLKTTLKSGQGYGLILTEQGVLFTPVEFRKPTGGNGESAQSFLIALANFTFSDNMALCRVDSSASPCSNKDASHYIEYSGYTSSHTNSDLTAQIPYVTKSGLSVHKASLFRQKSVRLGKWKLYFIGAKNGQVFYEDTGYGFRNKDQGGVYLKTIVGGTGIQDEVRVISKRLIPDNTVSILWQFPQIAVLTAGECLFAITGNEFAYSQAAPSMRALVQAIWLTTSAAGNLIIVVIEVLDLFSDMAWEFFVYAVIMFIVMMIFAAQSACYEYNDYSKRAVGDDCLESKELTG
uniref:Peptide transporter family 1 n=1 Tax=Bursaphelenchus xylophilus TaxID=6326 RepID=A0A1I7SFJ5_BURXY